MQSKTQKDNNTTERPAGVLRYTLSDPTFIDKGWTVLPEEKVVRKVNLYRMRPSHPECDWFTINKHKGIQYYDTGEKLAEFDNDGRSQLFYRNGRLALEYYEAQEQNAQRRIVIYSSGDMDARGRSYPITVLATFDHMGSGIVFDYSGKIRLKYNQTEGVLLDRTLGPVTHWKWHDLNEPADLQHILLETHLQPRDSEIFKFPQEVREKQLQDEEMVMIELQNIFKEKQTKTEKNFRPFKIKMKALKINEQFSLKILDQATIHIRYRDGTTHVKLNIGMVLDNKEIVDSDLVNVNEVTNSLEEYAPKSDSLVQLQHLLSNARYSERRRIRREKMIILPVSVAGADRFEEFKQKSFQPRHCISPISSTNNTACGCRNTPSLYYDTQF